MHLKNSIPRFFRQRRGDTGAERGEGKARTGGGQDQETAAAQSRAKLALDGQEAREAHPCLGVSRSHKRSKCCAFLSSSANTLPRIPVAPLPSTPHAHSGCTPPHPSRPSCYLPPASLTPPLPLFVLSFLRACCPLNLMCFPLAPWNSECGGRSWPSCAATSGSGE